jgi:hypothetical protein
MIDPLQVALEVLENVRGNINPERGYVDELEADVKRAITAIKEWKYPVEQPAPSALDGWLRVINEAMDVFHLGVANADDSYEAAKEKLNNLISMELWYN